MSVILFDARYLAAATKKLKSYFRQGSATRQKRLRPWPSSLIPRVNRRFRMSDQVNKFLGDSPGRTLVKLIVVSLIVGFVMKVFGWQPMDLVYNIRHFILDIWHTGFSALGQFGNYLLLGASIVIPIYIILRIFNYRR
jgi:hypothetical protein